jgi:hypothetical protein
VDASARGPRRRAPGRRRRPSRRGAQAVQLCNALSLLGAALVVVLSFIVVSLLVVRPPRPAPGRRDPPDDLDAGRVRVHGPLRLAAPGVESRVGGRPPRRRRARAGRPPARGPEPVPILALMVLYTVAGLWVLSSVPLAVPGE